MIKRRSLLPLFLAVVFLATIIFPANVLAVENVHNVNENIGHNVICR